MTQAFNLSQFANFVNSSGQVSASGLQSGVLLPSGTVSLYYQSSAPTGWTQVTTLDDYALRITNSTGGGTGGTTAFSTVFSNQNPSISIAGLSAGATTLSTAQIPNHRHGLGIFNNAGCGGGFASSSGGGCIPQYTEFTGGGGSHTHTVSGSATSSAITLNVRYANIIICSKN